MDWLTTFLITLLSLASYFVLTDFATYLGFKLDPFLSLAAPIVVAAAICLGLVIGTKKFPWRTPRAFKAHGLFVVIILAIIIRLAYLTQSSIFPDEYGVIWALETMPLLHLPAFLANYQQILGFLAIHPPLGFLLLSIGYMWIPNIVAARLVSVAFSTMTVALVYYLVREFGEPDLAVLTSAIYALVPHTALFLSLAATDGIANFFGLASFWIFIRAINRGSRKLGCLSGILLALALWTKAWVPFFWIILAIIYIALVHRRPVVHSLPILGLMCGLGIGLYLPWGLVNPAAFLHSTIGVLDRFLRPSISTTNIVTATKSPGQPALISLLGNLFPTLKQTGLSTVSYSELLVQLPLWITPPVLLLCLIGLGTSLKSNRRFGVFNFLWIAVPLMLLVPSFRDIRYLAVIAPCYSLMASAAVIRMGSGRARTTLASVLFASMFIFLAVSIPISNQMYGGVQDASFELARLGLANEKVLTNVPALTYYLPHLQLFVISTSDKSDVVLGILRANDIRAVVILHNSRGAWPELDNGTLQMIRGQFRGYVSGGPSDFSWYELYYDPSY